MWASPLQDRINLCGQLRETLAEAVSLLPLQAQDIWEMRPRRYYTEAGLVLTVTDKVAP